jgi:hypothetical protein
MIAHLHADFAQAAVALFVRGVIAEDVVAVDVREDALVDGLGAPGRVVRIPCTAE